jgi:hypothetical protein
MESVGLFMSDVYQKYFETFKHFCLINTGFGHSSSRYIIQNARHQVHSQLSPSRLKILQFAMVLDEKTQNPLEIHGYAARHHFRTTT